MDRKLIVEAIVAKRGRNFSTEDALREALKFLSDTNLLACAIELDIDTDAVLTVKQ